MTRLIDADALVAYFENLKGDTIAVTDAAAVADNAPTVSCAKCEYGPPPADAVGARTACLHCYCGDNWKRRQP